MTLTRSFVQHVPGEGGMLFGHLPGDFTDLFCSYVISGVSMKFIDTCKRCLFSLLTVIYLYNNLVFKSPVSLAAENVTLAIFRRTAGLRSASEGPALSGNVRCPSRPRAQPLGPASVLGVCPPADGRQRLPPIIVSRSTRSGGWRRPSPPCPGDRRRWRCPLCGSVAYAGLGLPRGPGLLTLFPQPSRESPSCPVSHQ